jgi:hypothetical protein
MPDTETQSPLYLVDFIDEVLIQCPECSGPATVISKARWNDRAPKVTCLKCAFTRRGWPAPDGTIVDAIARRRCPRCGRWLEKRYQRILAKRRQVVLSCPCKAQTAVDVSFRSVRLGRPYDPYFGYPLWFTKNIGDEVLWAYNRRHISFLRAYIGAGNRPRTPSRNGSLASRLPQWLKKGTRRAGLLRAITALERKTP